MKFDATAKDLPELNVLAMRHVGPYPEIGKVMGKLFAWAAPKGLLQFPKTKTLAVYYDDPETVDESELRSDLCITVPEGTSGDDGVSGMKIPGGRFAVAHVEIDQSEYGDAWDKLVTEWIPAHGYQPDPGRLCYELYLNNPEEHPEGKHIVEICEPVKQT